MQTEQEQVQFSDVAITVNDSWYNDAYLEQDFVFPQYQQGIDNAPKMRWQATANGRRWQERPVNETYVYPGNNFWENGQMLGGTEADSGSVKDSYTTNATN